MSEIKPQRLEEKPVYKCRIFEVYEGKIQLPRRQDSHSELDQSQALHRRRARFS